MKTRCSGSVAFLLLVAVCLLPLCSGCRTAATVPAYNPALPDTGTAKVTLEGGGLWQKLNRPADRPRISSIDGQEYPEWFTAKAFAFQPGFHHVRVAYQASGFLSTMHSLSFLAEANGNYLLRSKYDMGGMGGLQNLCLTLVDLKTGRTCASSHDWRAEYDKRLAATRARPVAGDKARIHFTRKSSLVGAVVPHYVMDAGEGLVFDTTILENSTVKANDDRMWNVRYIEMAGGAVQLYGWTVGEYFAPNAAFMGLVRSGETIVFDRPPGQMRLKAITTGGDEGVAPAFNVEAGKSYNVDYAYSFSGIDFVIKERK